MAKIVIEIGCGKITCQCCKGIYTDHYNICSVFCGVFHKPLAEAIGPAIRGYIRLPECLDAERKIVQEEQIMGMFLEKPIVESLLREVKTHINNSEDDPRMGGRAPMYLYELEQALETALSAGVK